MIVLLQYSLGVKPLCCELVVWGFMDTSRPMRQQPLGHLSPGAQSGESPGPRFTFLTSSVTTVASCCQHLYVTSRPVWKTKTVFHHTRALTFGSVAQTREYEELSLKNSEATCKLNMLFQNSQSNVLGYKRQRRKTHSTANAAESSPAKRPQAIQSVTLSPSMSKYLLCP